MPPLSFAQVAVRVELVQDKDEMGEVVFVAVRPSALYCSGDCGPAGARDDRQLKCSDDCGFEGTRGKADPWPRGVLWAPTSMSCHSSNDARPASHLRS